MDYFTRVIYLLYQWLLPLGVSCYVEDQIAKIQLILGFFFFPINDLKHNSMVLAYCDKYQSQSS